MHSYFLSATIDIKYGKVSGGIQMKKLLFLVVLVFSLFALVGCTVISDKEFTAAGITITLDNTFTQKEVVQAPLYLESLDHIFIGLRESKSSLFAYGIDTLAEYTQAVISNAGHDSEVLTFNEGEITFMYAYYEATVEDQDFGYMLICMEGADYFYTMNFGCLEKNLDGNKDQYIDWVKTIIVA